MTITPATEPFEPGDLLTCIADGYEPIYTWSGTVDGVAIATHTGSTYPLEAGVFDVTCTATVSELTCAQTAEVIVAGTAVGKCRIQLNTL